VLCDWRGLIRDELHRASVSGFASGPLACRVRAAEGAVLLRRLSPVRAVLTQRNEKSRVTRLADNREPNVARGAVA
jgi:hypothetical protein